jgi:Uma2 family endonuclease
MGLHTAYETLVLRWAELCNDPSLHDLPFKIELNGYGVMEMSPANTRHARYQAAITGELMRQLPHGTVLTECGIATAEEGVRVPDVAWASPEFIKSHGDATPLPQAPEICVEVLSPSNTKEEMAMKTRTYLTAGALEVWIVAVSGSIQVHNAEGPQAKSRYPVAITLKPI